ncbi:DUF4365 domain-containing protein [Flavobacterium sp.]|uniref:DUF4365 domain-containing protein n=1 Tax=Flavobacterium sp. TaxID=239 RepID=UPI002B4B6BAC|nr:DUF4365 domain-containing protein [Flavobacterium sp.]HLF50936.1 DUF4365 domain-containing protein [Flavobacterium sp.]
MKQKPEIVRTKNEATGMRVVSQYVTEFWECGWQPIEQRNDKGIDGLIIMRKGGKDIGVNINVQVKCGVHYISSYNKDEIKISISNKLNEHITYWKTQLIPTILVFVIPYIPKRDKHGNIVRIEVITDSGNVRKEIDWKESRIKAEAFWVNVKDVNVFDIDKKTIIKIDKKNRFGEHSKGDFLKLIEPYKTNIYIDRINLNLVNRNLLNSDNFRKDARQFYKDWKLIDNNYFPCKALGGEKIIISRTGWNHITNKSRGRERRNISLKLLGAAKQVIEEVEKYYLLQQVPNGEYLEQKIGIRGIVKTKNEGDKIIQVVILRKYNESKDYDKYWFYSVHHRQ